MSKQSSRRLRFSIWAMLVFMTAAALLLTKVNQEIRRAKAIETTRNKIGEWKGKILYAPRKSILTSFASLLPRYWTDEIIQINVSLFDKHEVFGNYHTSYTKIEPSELKQLIELGSFDHLNHATLRGSAFDYDAVSRICETPLIKRCGLHDVNLSQEEFNDLKAAYPKVDLHLDNHWRWQNVIHMP